MHILEEKVRAAKKHGRPALIPFITAGFPDRERFLDVLRELDGSGADVIEIGVPFPIPWRTDQSWKKLRMTPWRTESTCAES